MLCSGLLSNDGSGMLLSWRGLRLCYFLQKERHGMASWSMHGVGISEAALHGGSGSLETPQQNQNWVITTDPSSYFMMYYSRDKCLIIFFNFRKPLNSTDVIFAASPIHLGVSMSRP
jgi:hypothetical protein